MLLGFRILEVVFGVDGVAHGAIGAVTTACAEAKHTEVLAQGVDDQAAPWPAGPSTGDMMRFELSTCVPKLRMTRTRKDLN